MRGGQEGTGKHAGVLHRVGLSLRGNGSGTTTGGSSVWGQAFSLPIPDNLCDTPRMKNLTATICLTVGVLFRNAGANESADWLGML